MTIEISTDRARLDVDAIHRYLCEESYWAKGIPRELVERSIAHSLCFGAYDGSAQVGFARVITDYATFAYVADVFVLPSHRRRGLSKAIMRDSRAPGIAAAAALASGDPRRASAVRAVRVHAARSSGPAHAAGDLRLRVIVSGADGEEGVRWHARPLLQGVLRRLRGSG